MHAVFLAFAVAAVASGIPISGRVVDENGGPVGGAVVRVNTAKPRQGPQMTCPSCYTDCGKLAITDDQGRFRIDNVSTKLVFGLASGALGYQGQLLDDVDPLEPDLTLRVKRLANRNSKQTIAGRIVDLQGDPVPGAVVSVGSVVYHSGPMRGPDEGITPATVTDAEGNFALTARTPFRRLTLKIRASGYAAADVNSMMPGRLGPPIKIGPGASLMGRLVFDGSPVSAIKLELVQEDRRIGNVVTPQQIVTAEDGSFRWDHLQPEIDYAIYSLIGQEHPMALPVTITRTPASGMLADLGDVKGQPARRVKVRFVTKGNATIPEGSYCYLTRSRAWSSMKQLIPAKPGETFVFDGVASEVVGLGVRVPGYEVTATEPFYQAGLNGRFHLYPDGEQTVTLTLERVVSP